jgi:hypothetical protein
MSATKEYLLALRYPRQQGAALENFQQGLIEELERATDEEDRWPMAARAADWLARACHGILVDLSRVPPETPVRKATNHEYWPVRNHLTGERRQGRTREQMLTISTGCWPSEVEGYTDAVWEPIRDRSGNARDRENPVTLAEVMDELEAGKNFLRHARMVEGRLWRTEIPFDLVPPRDTSQEQGGERENRLELPPFRSWGSVMDCGDPAAHFTKADLPMYRGSKGRTDMVASDLSSFEWVINNVDEESERGKTPEDEADFDGETEDEEKTIRRRSPSSMRRKPVLKPNKKSATPTAKSSSEARSSREIHSEPPKKKVKEEPKAGAAPKPNFA